MEEIDVWLYGSLAFVAVGMVLIPVGESSDTPALTTTGIVAVSGGGLTALVNLGMRASIGFGK